MNQYVTGGTIKRLRERAGMTQTQLASKLNVSDRAVSKWETGRGYPDISLLEKIAEQFGISISELLSGEPVTNMNISANIEKVKFYVCPVCGNIICSVGDALISCHGITLPPLDAEPADSHSLTVEKVEDEYFVSSEHNMTKEHYISFMSAVSYDRVQLVKLYPEGNAEARFKINSVKDIYYYCNRDGLFKVSPGKDFLR